MAMHSTTTSRSRRTTSRRLAAGLYAALALLLALVGILPTGPLAHATDATFKPQTDFAIDGDITGTNDWLDFYGAGTTPGGYPTTGIIDSSTGTDPCGTGDRSGFPGSQTISKPNPWQPGTTTSDPNKKSDLCSAGSALEIVDVNGEYNYIFYGYWSREPKGTGDLSVFYPLEGPAAGRGDDLLVTFDYDPSGGVTVSIYAWTGTTWKTDTLDATQFDSATGNNIWPETGGAAGARNGTFG